MNRYEIAMQRAIDVLGNEERAEEWLEKMSGALGKSPKDILSEQEGLNRVLRHLHSVELALGRD